MVPYYRSVNFGAKNGALETANLQIDTLGCVVQIRQLWVGKGPGMRAPVNLIVSVPKFRFVKQLVLVETVKLGGFKTPISL